MICFRAKSLHCIYHDEEVRRGDVSEQLDGPEVELRHHAARRGELERDAGKENIKNVVLVRKWCWFGFFLSSHVTMQNRLMLALYTVKSIPRYLVGESNI